VSGAIVAFIIFTGAEMKVQKSSAGSIPDNDPAKPLAGVKILDLTSVVMGPYATQIMADLGATVFKIEGPEGDTTRRIGAGSEVGLGGTFLNLNRNKLGVGLDLKRPEARTALKRMLKSVDIFVHSMRAKAISRLGLSYADVADINPELIYVNGWGFGKAGPYEHKSSLDDVIQAASGMVGLVEEATGAANYVPTVLADKISGLTMLYAMLAALHGRQHTGKGVEVEVPMFESVASFLLCEHASDAVFDPPRGRPVYRKSVSRNHRPFGTLDGRISVVLFSDKQWKNFGKLVGVDDLLSRPSFATLSQRAKNPDEVYSFVAEQLRLRTTEQWQEALDEVGIPVMPIQTLDNLYQDDHLSSVGFFQPVNHDGMRARYPSTPVLFGGRRPQVITRAPALGQDNETALSRLGFDSDEIAALIESGAVFSEQQ
jgi:crotonobetainyl-CoA:carnitine CoA-transferase CaiB-like acyl-CoA transferase